MFLSEMKVGTSGTVTGIQAPLNAKKRLLAMGLTPGAEFKVVKVAPMGDPIEVTLRGYRLTLRKSEAAYLQTQETGIC